MVTATVVSAAVPTESDADAAHRAASTTNAHADADTAAGTRRIGGNRHHGDESQPRQQPSNFSNHRGNS
jgi:hypothetical protein